MLILPDVLSRPNEIDTAAIQAAVQAKYGIPIDFLGGRTLNEVKNSKDVMSTRQIKKKNEFAAIETDEKIQAVTMLDANGLAHLDQQSADVSLQAPCSWTMLTISSGSRRSSQTSTSSASSSTSATSKSLSSVHLSASRDLEVTGFSTQSIRD